MDSLLNVIFVIAMMITVVVIVIVRLNLKRKSYLLEQKLDNILKDYNCRTCDVVSGTFFCKLIDSRFQGSIITTSQKDDFVKPFMLFCNEVQKQKVRLEMFCISQPKAVQAFVKEVESLSIVVKNHNEKVIAGLLKQHEIFFDNCLKYPLDRQQRRSIVSEEDNCLVVSSAGSGKTSSIVGKVKYLTEIKGIAPNRILLISYTNKAAAELTERIATKGLNGYTFHKLALDIIGKQTGVKPSICDNTDSVFVEIYQGLLDNKHFRKSVVEYFAYFQIEETDKERRDSEMREKLSSQKKTQLRAMFPDMDGRIIFVRSKQEQAICFALSTLGIKFRYEEPYEHKLADEMHSQYRPDFSIYFEKDGKTKRVYLEHFGVDEHGLVPGWFAKDKNITHEEACKLYNDGITWKKAAHEKFGTQLLVTSSADFQHFDIKDKLRDLLKNAGVPIKETPEESLYELILPKGSKREKVFIRLVITFVMLLKSSCKSVFDVLKQAKKSGDERSVFIIKNIFQPVFNCYVDELKQRAQIDFTDAILQATEICKESHPVEYDYIIVDEFQDISVDRYNFLRVLRDGNPPAKLYCVGDDWQSIYRFSGSDMVLFNQFPSYFGATEINKIETTYRFGEPLVCMSSKFIQRNNAQIKKNIHSFNSKLRTDLEFCGYSKEDYCDIIRGIVESIPSDKSIFLLGRYSFDDLHISGQFKAIKERDKFFYIIGERKIEFLTVHKSKGLEADYVILLQCNKDTYGFPSLVSDDSVLSYVLTESDQFPFGEERRLFYVAITRAKNKTIVLYDRRIPSVFVDEFLHPEEVPVEKYVKHPNANKNWTRGEERYLLMLYKDGQSIRQIAAKLGRSQTSIVMRLEKLNQSR